MTSPVPSRTYRTPEYGLVTGKNRVEAGEDKSEMRLVGLASARIDIAVTAPATCWIEQRYEHPDDSPVHLLRSAGR